jgi:DNA-binding transcriptional MerR regulator
MDLEEIRTLLRFKDQPEENCGEVNELLDDHIQHVGTRIKELRKLETELKALRSACGETQEAMRCGILKQLSDAPIAAVEVSKSHVGHVHGRPRKAAR